MNYNIQTRRQSSLVLSVKFWAITLVLILLYTTIIFAQTTVYVDPTNSGDPGQNGTLDHPWDSWTDFSIQDNTTYLQKRGTTSILTGYINIENKSHVTISTYGDGDRPHLMQMVSNTNVFRVNRSSHIRIEGFKVEMPVGAGSGVIAISAHGTNGIAFYNYVIDCEIIGGWRGINSEVWPSEITCEIGNLYIEDCIIHEQTDDGIFCKTKQNAAYDTIVVRGCHIYRVNLTWLTNPANSGGDPIHLLRCTNFLIENNILDKRITSYKFCFISAMGALGTEKGIVRFNTMYPPKDTVGYSSNAFYIGPGHDSVWFYGNKFIGRGYTNGQHAGAAGYFVGNYANFSYNIFDSVGYIAIGTPTEYKEFNNNLIRFIHFGSTDYFLATGNQPTYLRNNIFLMPNGTQLYNDGMNGGANVFIDNNIELYSDDLQGFDDEMHFADIYNYDFHLTENSTLARNQGIEYPGALDCDADSVPVPMEDFRDIGVFEYFDSGQTNSSPVILNQAFSLDENSSNGTVVGTVIATDPDAGQTLTYSIQDGNILDAFQINSSTGVLTVNNSEALDFEIRPVFSLTVMVQDNGIGYLTDQAIVTVNLNDVNENPNIEDQSFAIDENSANASAVGSVVASDPDNGQALTYSIISGNTDNAFEIGSTSGELTVANSSALNFEDTPVFMLTVKVEDDGTGNLSDQATITVNLTDVNEPPVMLPQDLTLDVDAALIQHEINNNILDVGIITASDPDAGQSVTFSIIAGNDRNIWGVNSNTGEVQLLDPYQLNPVEINNYLFTIEVVDNSPEQLAITAELTIIVNIYTIYNFDEENELASEIDNNTELKHSIYPNPASNYLKFDLENMDENPVSITVTNLNGEIVLYREYQGNNDKLSKQIDITGLSKGMYIIYFQNGKVSEFDKFIKL